MTCHNAPQPVPLWTDDELAQMFWRHNNRGLAWIVPAVGADIAAVALGLTGNLIPAAFALAVSGVLSAQAFWHLGRSRLLTQLRFRGRAQ